jgi:hypothetical protein
MSTIINYISTNCNSRNNCISCIMNFYHTFKYRPELELLTDTEVFDSFVDKSIKQNQKILSDIYIYIENGDIKEAIELFIFNTKY